MEEPMSAAVTAAIILIWAAASVWRGRRLERRGQAPRPRPPRRPPSGKAW